MLTDSLVRVEERTLAAAAAAQLRVAIHNGSMPAGTRLIERELAERLGMSRIPVREAIGRLVEEGLVEKIPHKGTFVYAPTPQEVEEIASLRVVLERFAVERAVANWKPEHEGRLREIVAKMRRARDRGDREMVSQLDSRLHEVVWEIAEHGVLLEIASSLHSRISRFHAEAIGMPLPDSELDALLTIHVEGHDQLIDALKSGDVAAAQELYSDHIRGGARRILAHWAARQRRTEG